MGSPGERRLRVAMAAIGAAGAMAAAIAGSATGVTAGEALPDLVSDAPTGATLQTYVDGGGTRLLLRFNGYIHNQGAGPLEIVGRTPASGRMTSTVQRIYDTSGALAREDASGNPRVLYETADGHDHWHLRAATRYALYDAAKRVVVAPSQKVGFCLADSAHVDPFGPSGQAYSQSPTGPLRYCERLSPGAAQVTMGISSGWRDVYSSNVAFQWIDVSNVPPGAYWIAASSDPDGVVIESSEANNGAVFAATSSVIPGFAARPVVVSSIVPGQATPVTLDATSYGGGAMARKFTIVAGPTRGTIDQPVGQPFDGPTVTYTPPAGFSGSDSFTYEAHDANSAFPRSPVIATVTLTATAAVPTVSISGAPASMLSGTSVQLSATVTADPPTVEWRANGILGGTEQSGTITSAGLYTAPETPPPDGRVTIRASSGRAASEVTIRVDPQPVPAPAPAPEPAATPTPGPSTTAPATPAPPVEKPVEPAPLLPPTRPAGGAVSVRPPLLGGLVLARQGRVLVIGARSGKAGTIHVSAWKGQSRLGRCITRTPAARSLTCQIRLRPGIKVAGVRVVAQLLVDGRAVAYRRATFSRQLAFSRRSGLQCWLPAAPGGVPS